MASFQPIQLSAKDDSSIYRLQFTWRMFLLYRLPCSTFLIRLRNGNYVLVDPGFDRWASELKKAVEAVIFAQNGEKAEGGKLHQRVVALIATHKHDDHSQAAKSLLEERKELVLFVGKQERTYYEGHGFRLRQIVCYDSDYPANPAFLDKFHELCGTDLEILHTPGHTPGHLGVLHVSLQTLLAGDALTNFSRFFPWRPHLDGPVHSSTENIVLAHDTINKLVKLRPTDLANRRNAVAEMDTNGAGQCECSTECKCESECECGTSCSCECNSVWKCVYVSHDNSGVDGIAKAEVAAWVSKHCCEEE